ncbi:unnamed protein product, partial [Scytosiphon promiscuus]
RTTKGENSVQGLTSICGVRSEQWSCVGCALRQRCFVGVGRGSNDLFLREAHQQPTTDNSIFLHTDQDKILLRHTLACKSWSKIQDSPEDFRDHKNGCYLCVECCIPASRGFLCALRLFLQASQLTAAFHQTRIHRRLAAKRRSERLARFRKVQDELLRPTKLCRLDRTGACEDNFEMAEPGHSQAPCLDEVACRNLNLAEEQTRRDRVRRAHDLALAAAKSRKCWTVSLPPDIGYDELIDIRHVRPSWPTFSVRGRAPLEFVDGFVRNHNKHVGKIGGSPGDHQLHSDEASLWWYVHSAAGIHRTGLLQQDRVFAHLLERAKATSTRRKEHAERGERQHQSYVSRKRRTAIDEVIHQQQVASCQNLSYTRKRVTQEQRSAATLIQSYIRRFLGRKQALLLRTETKIFGALQV